MEDRFIAKVNIATHSASRGGCASVVNELVGASLGKQAGTEAELFQERMNAALRTLGYDNLQRVAIMISEAEFERSAFFRNGQSLKRYVKTARRNSCTRRIAAACSARQRGPTARGAAVSGIALAEPAQFSSIFVALIIYPIWL